jgi:hypothetical protein
MIYNGGAMTVENAQKLLEALAPDKWVELSNAVKTSCLNARTIHVEFEESPTSLIVKRIENGWHQRRYLLPSTWGTHESNGSAAIPSHNPAL